MHLSLQIDKNCFARFNVALKRVRCAFQRHRFAGQEHRARAVRTTPHAQRSNAKWVAKRQHAVAREQGDHGVGTLDAAMHVFNRRKNIRRLQWQAPGCFLNLVGQHIEKHLGVALGVDVPVIRAEQLIFQRLGIGQVAVVHQHDAKRRIDIKRLGFLLAVGVARRGIAHLAQATIAGQ